MYNRSIWIAVAVFALSLFAPTFLFVDSAEALKVRCDLSGCKVYCTQQLGNGLLVEYEEGTEITVTNQETGEEFKYKCVNGQWVQQARVLPGAGIIGSIGVESIGGVMGELTTQVCNDSPEPVCTPIENLIGPPGLLKSPGCDPNRLACP